MSNLIRVMAAKVDDRVLLWEKHPKHPSGEVFIKADGTSTEAFPTTKIKALMETGKLVKMQVHSSEPIEGYDNMTAAEIIKAAASMTDDENIAALEYETANKARTTVLKALTDGSNAGN